MTNNIIRYKNLIKQMLLDFPKSNKKTLLDKFYVIEIIGRGKDNPNTPAANNHFKNYYIYCWDDFDRYMPEIIKICDVFNKRAYASVNWKSNKQIAMNTVASMATRIAQGDFKKINAEWESQTGLYQSHEDKIWILDLDNTRFSSPNVAKVMNVVSKCTSEFDDIVITKLPTKSGVHLLTHPFNIKQFSQMIENNEDGVRNSLEKFEKREITEKGDILTNWINKHLIHKNHITLLYENLT